VHWTGLTIFRGKGSSAQGSPRALASDGYCICEGAAGPGRAKTSSPGRKTVPGPVFGSAGEGPVACGKATWVRTQQSATMTGLPGSASAALEVADGDDLIPGPDSDGEGAGSAAQDGIGAIVEQLKGWNDASMADPDEWGGEELS
jgi:hypothetical protein